MYSFISILFLSKTSKKLFPSMFFGISIPAMSKIVGITSTNDNKASDLVLGFIFLGHLITNGVFSPFSYTPHLPDIPWSDA